MTIEELKQFVSQNDLQNDPQKYTDRQKTIIALLSQQNTLARKAIAIKIGVSVETIRRDLKVIGASWEGPAKSGHWKIKR